MPPPCLRFENGHPFKALAKQLQHFDVTCCDMLGIAG